jgi:predicted transposase/invertase (TIGR01784 family)
MMASLGEAARLALEELMERGQYEFQSEYAKRYIGMGEKQGSEAAMLLVARRLLDEGMPVAKVAAITDLTEDQVRQLQH